MENSHLGDAGNAGPAGDLVEIVDQKITALVMEMQQADWGADDVAVAIHQVIRVRWLDQAEALARTRAAVGDDYVSDGNEG